MGWGLRWMAQGIVAGGTGSHWVPLGHGKSQSSQVGSGEHLLGSNIFVVGCCEQEIQGGKGKE